MVTVGHSIYDFFLVPYSNHASVSVYHYITVIVARKKSSVSYILGQKFPTRRGKLGPDTKTACFMILSILKCMRVCVGGVGRGVLGLGLVSVPLDQSRVLMYQVSFGQH